MKPASSRIARLDQAHVWHPFTQMRDWLRREPIVIASGRGAVLRDMRGREYLDANSSIWTNLHGHRQPRIDAAIRRQLGKISHCSALGLANEPASVLASKLVAIANPFPGMQSNGATKHVSRLGKVFFSDDGSTAIEVALKLAYEFARRARGIQHPRFLSLKGAYHGDTVGATSLGQIDLFHKAWAGLRFKTDAVMAPYCYRCPFNRARPERGDAREYRKCHWECVRAVEKKFSGAAGKERPYAAMVVEPLIQGAAGMIPQPQGWLRRVAEIVRGNGAQLVADEVMTAFGRVGQASRLPMVSNQCSVISIQQARRSGKDAAGTAAKAPLDSSIPNASKHAGKMARRAACPAFACHHEGVQPDFLAVAKGLTGGYLPMAATLTTQPVFDAFLGDYEDFKTFFHGHSYTGNPLGAVAALASLEVLESSASLRSRRLLEHTLSEELKSLWALPQVGDIRQVGLVAGVELVRDWVTRAPFDLRERAGIRVCEAMASRGVLTRPIGNVIVLMPPYCTTPAQARRMVAALHDAIGEVFAARTFSCNSPGLSRTKTSCPRTRRS